MKSAVNCLTNWIFMSAMSSERFHAALSFLLCMSGASKRTTWRPTHQHARLKKPDVLTCLLQTQASPPHAGQLYVAARTIFRIGTAAGVPYQYRTMAQPWVRRRTVAWVTGNAVRHENQIASAMERLNRGGCYSDAGNTAVTYRPAGTSCGL